MLCWADFFQVLAWGAMHGKDWEQMLVMMRKLSSIFFFSFLFSPFSVTQGAIFTYWSLPRSLYTSINPRLSTFWVLGADCANLPNSLLSCLGLEDACCAWCSNLLFLWQVERRGVGGRECDSKEWRGTEVQCSRGAWEGLGFPCSGSWYRALDFHPRDKREV